MVVDSCNSEFGYELIATLPWAYALHLNGELIGTRSGMGSSPLYYFSPHHDVNPSQRDWDNTKDCKAPNIWIHKPVLDKTAWVPPPLKDHYASTAIRFEKPTVVIYNRYNHEWGRPPINYFDLPTLRRLFEMLLPKYDIVYFNIRGQERLEDNAHSMDLGDYEMIRNEFPQVNIIHDLVYAYGGDYNLVQLRVFAGCERFITMNGAGSILASYFGGENIIYSKECRELWPTINSFYNWYPDFGGSVIKVVNTHDDLVDIVRDKWVREKPLINILVRCHRRERSLDRLYESLKSQPYKNWNVIASYDDEQTWKYLCKYPFEKVECTPVQRPDLRPDGEEYARFLAPNLYFNEMMKRVKSGYIMYLDDDDYFAAGNLPLIAAGLEEDRLLLWRTQLENGRLIPSDGNWGNIVAGDISGIAFAFHHSHKHIAQWEPWRRGDYRVIQDLSNHLEPLWLDQVCTIIGRVVPEKGTSDYIARKKAEFKITAESINASVARKKAERPPRPPRRVMAHPGNGGPSCPCCGRLFDQK